ncbi:exosome complex component rrp40-like [Cicer arietinum]|uniref:exosome complex component rrp40-like n=1 Tax=Cicer arietinum TaxID=3827 RepID=UPI003CC5BCA6
MHRCRRRVWCPKRRLYVRVFQRSLKKLSFEIAVGLNRRVWVNASSPSTTIIVANVIMNSETLSGVQQKIMAEKLLQRV